MKIKEIIEKIIKDHQQIRTILDRPTQPGGQDKDIISFLKLAFKSGLSANSSLADKIADCLQLLNENQNFEQIELEEIGKLYDELIRVHPYDIALYESAYFFFDTILDKGDRARQILDEGINKIEAVIIKLKEHRKEN